MPKPARLAHLLHAVVDLASSRKASPREIASLSGVLHWHDLMNRPLYSCLHAVYAFTKQEDDQALCDLSDAVMSEIVLNVSLFPL